MNGGGGGGGGGGGASQMKYLISQGQVHLHIHSMISGIDSPVPPGSAPGNHMHPFLTISKIFFDSSTGNKQQTWMF